VSFSHDLSCPEPHTHLLISSHTIVVPLQYYMISLFTISSSRKGRHLQAALVHVVLNEANQAGNTTTNAVRLLRQELNLNR
jgi:hypothetical protein